MLLTLFTEISLAISVGGRYVDVMDNNSLRDGVYLRNYEERSDVLLTVALMALGILTALLTTVGYDALQLPAAPVLGALVPLSLDKFYFQSFGDITPLQWASWR